MAGFEVTPEDQIGLIEERHLQLAAGSQFLDLGGA
jgi:hypothetical protein